MIEVWRREQKGMPVPGWQRAFSTIKGSARTIVLRLNEAADAV